MDSLTDKLTLFPFARGISSYTWIALRKDLIAALTVALIALPQSMAYALVAGLPTSVGIFAAIFGTIFTATFGSSRHLISGPTNTVAILLQAATSQILYLFYKDVDPASREIVAVQIVIELTFIVGIIQVLAALTRMARLAQFVSRPVVKGYVLGAALAIIVNQSFTFFGLGAPEELESLFAKVFYLLTHITEFHLPTLLIGVLSLTVLIVLKQIGLKVPAAAIAFALSALAVLLLGPFTKDVALVRHVGPLGELLPRVAAPYLDLRILNVIVPISFAIALLGVIEVTSIVKSLAPKSREHSCLSQEVFGLGLANIFSSCFGAMPSSGSFTRTRLNLESGAATRAAAILSGLFVAAFAFPLGSLVGFIPLASLAALLFVTAIGMVDWREFVFCIRTTYSDALALVVTLIACLLFSIDVAFYVGVLISIALYLKKAASPTVREMTVGKRGQVRPTLDGEELPHPQIRIIDVDGELFFGACDFFQATLRTITTREDVQVVILRLKNAHHLDATTCLALKHINEYLKQTNRTLILCGLTQQVWKVLKKSKLMNQIGRDNLFVSDPLDPIGSTRRAFLRAEQLSLLVDTAFPEEPVQLVDPLQL